MQSMAMITGQVALTLSDAEGRVIASIAVSNIVVSDGKNVIADRMKSTPTLAAMSHMAVGTNNTATSLSDTALGAEVAASRTSLTSTTVSGAEITYIATFGAGVGTGSLAEAGIFNHASTGEMLCRTVFPTITKGGSDTLTVTWKITVS